MVTAAAVTSGYCLQVRDKTVITRRCFSSVSSLRFHSGKMVDLGEVAAWRKFARVGQM